MKIPTCTDCANSCPSSCEDSIWCLARDRGFDADQQFCPLFEAEGNKRPRFCRLASDINEMASEMVEGVATGWRVPMIDGAIYPFFDYAIAVAKNWLLEMEDCKIEL